MRAKRGGLQDQAQSIGGEISDDAEGNAGEGQASASDDADPEAYKTARPDLEAQLERLRVDRADVLQRAAVARQRLADDDWYVDASDEAIEAEDKVVAKADRRAHRMAAIEARILEQLRIVDEREADAARVARYQAAAEKAAEASGWIAGEYAACSAAIGAGLARLGAIADELAIANADRPEGTPPLDFEAFRALPATPPIVEHVPETYYVDANGRELRPTDDAPLGQDGSGRFYVGGRPVVARERQAPVRTPGRPAAVPRPLAAAVRLPGVRYADPDFWPQRSKLWGL